MSQDHATFRFVSRSIIPVAFALLPPEMASPRARAMLLAIGLQESDEFQYRIQQPVGPARGFWQFEKGGGIHGVMTHPRSSFHLQSVLTTLRYPESTGACYTAVMHNDVLACVFARLLLWTLPNALPVEQQPNQAWNQYMRAWRPGKPHREKWNKYYEMAWHEVNIRVP